jgi:hypothetical protein
MDDESSFSADLRDRLRPNRGGGDTPATLALSDQEGYVGDEISLQGRNLSADTEYTIRWHTTDGQWGVLSANEVIGPQYQPRTEEVATVLTDEDGEFEEEWTVPKDYGGPHRVDVVDDGTVVAAAQYSITPWFEIDKTDAEMGRTFTITGYGIGPNLVTNNYQISWDNGYVGFLTGVMNHGTATAQIRAVGPPGEHVVQVWRNQRGVPYLQNNTQSPYGPVAGSRRSAWTVEVTAPAEPPRRAWVDPLYDEDPIEAHYPTVDADTDAELSITPSSGQAGTTVFVTGEQFPPNEDVDLIWYRHEGHRVEGEQITPEPRPAVLPSTETDDEGSFQVEAGIPRDQGSTRPITATIDGREVAVTGFMMQPSIETFVPGRGPVGTDIEIELSGIGWTAYENAPYFVYDNKPLGYVSGTAGDETDGTVRAELKAAGEPGWHFIDVYPSLFDMQEEKPEFTVKPHLSYVDNHPIRPIPALHFAFEVTE